MCKARARSASWGTYLKQIGSTPLMVADDQVWGFVAHDVGASLAAAGLPVHRENFNGNPSAREVDLLAGVIKQTGADEVADAATVEGETIHSMPFDVHSQDVASALVSIERFAVQVREDAKLPAPVPYAPHH
jgi:glycerol dehydrogenase-like iron-containing ADH family enzyme